MGQLRVERLPYVVANSQMAHPHTPDFVGRLRVVSLPYVVVSRITFDVDTSTLLFYVYFFLIINLRVHTPCSRTMLGA